MFRVSNEGKYGNGFNPWGGESDIGKMNVLCVAHHSGLSNKSIGIRKLQ